MTRTATRAAGRGPALPGRLASSLRGAGLYGAALAGAGAAGALVSLRAAYPRPFWLVADWVAAAILVLLIATSIHFHH